MLRTLGLLLLVRPFNRVGILENILLLRTREVLRVREAPFLVSFVPSARRALPPSITYREILSSGPSIEEVSRVALPVPLVPILLILLAAALLLPLE